VFAGATVLGANPLSERSRSMSTITTKEGTENGTVEVAGPEQFRLDELIRRALEERDDPREVLPDPHTTYYGAELNERTLFPGDDASLAETRFEDWLSRSTAQQQRTLIVKGV
jgi:uncharacterized protein YbjT (DUF2867 family)